MKFYLSSYRIGNETKKLKKMLPKNRKTAYISNALDDWDAPEKRKEHETIDIAQLNTVGLRAELLDLRKYFNKKEELRKKLDEYGAVWVSGGNTFVLRQAMKLSGFDEILKNLVKTDMLYGGYSAGICVLSPSLNGIELVDNPKAKPYKNSKLLMDGLGILEYSIVPHYKSDHPESEAMSKEVDYYKRKKIPFQTLIDGEVIIIH